MEAMTELQARLERPDAETVRQEIVKRLVTLETRLQTLRADPVQTRETFARLTVLATAAEMAQKVMSDTTWVQTWARSPSLDS